MSRRRPATAVVPTYRIRSVTSGDIEVLVRHRERMFSDLDHWDLVDPRALREALRAYRPWLRRRMRARKLTGFIAESGRGSVLGSALVVLRDQPPRPRWPRGELPYVMNVYTVPEARGHGVATGLVEEILQWSRARGFPRVVLNASDMGRGVYERLGFEGGTEMRLQLLPLAPETTARARSPRRKRRRQGRRRRAATQA